MQSYMKKKTILLLKTANGINNLNNQVLHTKFISCKALKDIVLRMERQIKVKFPLKKIMK